MARGFESKGVESQIADREAMREWKRRERSPEDIERQSRRDSLESSRRGVVRELEAAHSPLRRASLEHALKHLDDELRKV